MERTLEITVAPLPAHPHGIACRLQRGKAELLEGEPVDGGVRFTATLRVEERGSAPPRWLGPFAQGTPAERFVYLVWGVLEEDGFRRTSRMKLFLTAVERASWSQPGITWDQVRADAIIRTTVDGQADDGGPRCAGCPVQWTT